MKKIHLWKHFFASVTFSIFLFANNIFAQCRLLNEPFNANPVLSATNVDGTWYPDRYRPAGFESAVLGSSNVLKISIDGVADGALNRPVGQQGTFYNTQGRKFNQCGGCVTVLKGDLWIPAGWDTKHRRTDMWATAYDATNAISAYPIIGFRNPDGGSPGIYYWDENIGWINSGVAIVYDSWYNLAFRLVGPNIEYLVNNVIVGTIASGGSTYLGDIIMQAYNFNDPALPPVNQSTDSYDAYWDNLITTGTGGNLVTNIITGQTFCSIQAAIDAASANDVISVYPGNYSETAINRTPVSTPGTYTFGLYISPAKNGITIQGVDALGVPVTNYGAILANVETNATDNFGPDGIFMEGDNVTITGLKIWQNPALGTNKTITVIGDNFNLKNCIVTDISATDPWGSVYIDDELYNTGTNTSHIQSYNIEGNWLKNCSIDPNNGAGYSGPVAGRKIINNNIQLGPWAGASISFSGSGTGVPWFIHGVGGAIITGNTFSENAQHIRVRGDYDISQFNWTSYWNDNTFDKAVITGINPPTDVREYSYISGYGPISHVRRIGAVIQSEVDNVALTGDLVKVAAGTYKENVIVNKSITIHGAGASNTFIDESGSSSAGNMVTISGVTGNVTVSGFTIRTGNASLVASNAVALSGNTGGIININHNVLTAVQSASGTAQDNYGLIAQGSSSSLVFDNNTVNGGGDNPILLEQWTGASSITNNTIYRGPEDASKDAIFIMNYGTNDITTQQLVSGNIIDLGGGTIFTNATRSAGISFTAQFTGGAGPGGFTNVQITNNIIQNLKTFRRGISLWDNSSGAGDIVATISGNEISAAPTYTGQFGIRPIGGVTGTIVRNNKISGVEKAFLGASWPSSGSPSGSIVTYNSLLGTIKSIDWADGSGTLTATCNWYGSWTGPNHTTNPAGTGIPVSGSVTFEPWLTSGVDASLNIGFQPLPDICQGTPTMLTDNKCGKKNEKKVFICHNGNTICISNTDLQSHFDHGDKLGSCTGSSRYTEMKGMGNTEESIDLLPMDYQLSNYPNPFSSVTKILVEIPEDSKLSLKVYDVTGREVSTLIKENRKAGRIIVEFNASGLGSGVYYAKLEATANEKVIFKSIKIVKQ